MLDDILSGKQRSVTPNANIELSRAQIIVVLLCVLSSKAIESGGDIFEHIVTYYAIAIK